MTTLYKYLYSICMSLDHILLGMLSKPASGYDLKIEFNQGARHFWSAELSQIYPALKCLEAKGLLECAVKPSAKGPDRKVYRRTKDGRAELMKWLEDGPIMGTQRFAYVAQLSFFAELGDLERTLDFILELRVQLVSFLAFLEATMADISLTGEDLPDEMFHDYLCLRMGVTSIRARIAWCDESVNRISERQRASGTKEVTHD